MDRSDPIRDTHRGKAIDRYSSRYRRWQEFWDRREPDLDSEVCGLKRSTVCRITEAANMRSGNSRSIQNGGVKSIEETRKRMFSRRPWMAGWRWLVKHPSCPASLYLTAGHFFSVRCQWESTVLIFRRPASVFGFLSELFPFLLPTLLPVKLE